MSRPDLSFLFQNWPPEEPEEPGKLRLPAYPKAKNAARHSSSTSHASGGNGASHANGHAGKNGAGYVGSAMTGLNTLSASLSDDTLGELVNELRNYQFELETQNKVLRFSQASAESASERFEALFSSVPLALMVIDERDMVVQANSMAHRSFQPTEHDPRLISLMPFVSEGDTERVRRAFDIARMQGRCDSSEVVFNIGENRRMTGDLHIACIETQQDSLLPLRQYLCAVIDQGPLIAERQTLQQRNEQLHASERRLEAIINSALDAIICVDQDRRITVFNPTAAALFQCATHDALGCSLDRFLPQVAQALDFMHLTTQAVLGEMTARTATGRELAVEVSISFERHADGETTTVFARDLTGRKKVEARRNELEAQLRESQKMQAVGTMAGGIAHDFNNILHAILGNVELAKADALAHPGDSPVLESLREIEKAGRRARDLVRQILTFSRNEPPQRGAVQVAEVMHDTERLLRVTLPPGIDLQVQAPEHLPPVLADATQIEQALLNLCTNAVHAIGQGRGSVLMRAEALHQPEPHLCERLNLPAGPYVMLQVTDNGPGIDAATLPRIFEPFFTTKPVGQGTGLGLSVVHGVMRTHGGAVDVQSSQSGAVAGTCFTLYFPVAPRSASPVPSAAPSVSPVLALPPPSPSPLPSSTASSAPCADAGGQVQHSRKRHVMYVDDDQALVFLVQRLLKRRGYEVSGFTDPHQATAALQADPQRFDLLVTDYNMPGYSGVDLLHAARAIRADLPVALASGYVTAEIEQAALAAGARALIHKPNDVAELCATVDQLIHGYGRAN